MEPISSDGKMEGMVDTSDNYDMINTVSRDFMLAFFLISTTFRSYKLRQPLFSCDFEAGWCPGFENSDKSDIDWELNRGGTPSNETGPNGDHTRFNKDGQYIFMETSKRKFGEKAIFYTPAVDMYTSDSYCLSFWANMYGSGIGGLKIFRPVGPGISKKHALVFTITGEESKDGDDWILFQVSLSKSTLYRWTKPSRFEFQAFRGVSYKSDLAIDDILLTEGSCIPYKPVKIGTTAVFGQTRAPTAPTTPRPWQASDPRFAKCGPKYYEKKKKICCNKVVRNVSGNTQCCPKGTQAYRTTSQKCCGDEHPYWLTTEACCEGKKVYKKNTMKCVAGDVVPM